MMRVWRQCLSGVGRRNSRRWFGAGCALTLVLIAATAFSNPVEQGSVTLIYTNDTNGYLQACGCTAKQVGGLAKRATLIKQIKALAKSRRSPVLLIDGGDLGEDQQTSEAVLESMHAMQYQAVALGDLEERIGAPFVRKAKSLEIPVLGTPLMETDKEIQPTLIVHAGQVDIGIVNIRGELTPAFSVFLRSTLQSLRDKVQIVVALSSLTFEQEQRLAQDENMHGLLDLIIGMRGSSRMELTKINGVTLVPAAPKGNVGVVNLSFVQSKLRFAHHFEEVSGDLPSDDQVQDIVTAYYNRQAQKLLEASLSPEVDWTVLHYEPSERCGECHTEALRLWQTSKHALATQTLKAKDRLVPACLSCHSELYRRNSKFNPELNAAWHGVECTTCHGNGVLHSALRKKQFIARSVSASVCRKCHDAENDPKFDYDAYLAKIKHW